MKNFRFSLKAWEHNNTRLTNQIFKLLPMFEENEDWEKQRETILLELLGYNDMFIDNPGFMVLIGHLRSLSHCEDQMIFRKVIFQAITALKEIKI